MSEMVPENWTTEDLGKSLISLPKSSYPSSISDKNGYYNFYVCSSDIQRSFKCDKTEPAVLFSTGGEAAIHYASGKYSYSTDVWATKYSKNLTNEFVFRFIELNISRINNLGFQGSGIKHLDKDYIKKIKITYPPLPEQKKIASILTSVDEVIEKTQLQINKLQDLKKGTMNELLTKGIGHTEFKDSEFGRIPKSWEVKSLRELSSKIGSGVTPRGGSSVYQDQGIIFIRSQNVHFDGLKLDDVVYISDKIHASMSGSTVYGGDVLLNITGASIGRCTVVPDIFTESNVNQHVCIIRPTNLLHNRFLGMWLSSGYGQDQIMKFQAGGNREGLNFEQIRSITIPIPSFDEQKHLGKVVNSIQASINEFQLKLHQTKSLKKSLIQDLLTGKVRVKVN